MVRIAPMGPLSRDIIGAGVRGRQWIIGDRPIRIVSRPPTEGRVEPTWEDADEYSYRTCPQIHAS